MRILFTSTQDTSFLREDVRLLRKHWTVDLLIERGALFLFRLPGKLFNADLTFTWFASVYSAIVVCLARLARKPSIVVVGGVDAARLPEIDYGIWLSRWKSRFVRYAVTRADRILVVDPFLGKELRRLAEYGGENIVDLPTGYDSERWRPGAGVKEPRILTVAGCDVPARMQMKGIPLLLEAARAMPDVPFTLVGPRGAIADQIRTLAPPNLEVIEFLPRDELLEFYQRSKVYCQPSVFEGLPNSICEAMLCACVPVGTEAGGIPTAIGRHGFVVPQGDRGALVSALTEALHSNEALGQRARDHIREHFPLEKREQGLRRIVQGLLP